LLGEIATLVQLSGQELGELWAPAAPRVPAPAPSAPARAESDWNDWNDRSERVEWVDDFPRPSSSSEKRRFKSWRKPSPPLPPPGGRKLPTSRADVAARLILSNMAEWERLSQELHALLCDLPGEHGQLFAWLDSQSHEHGVQPWAALREGMRAMSFEALALRVMTGPDGGPIGDAEGEQAIDSARELRNVLDYMLDDLLKVQQSEAIAAVGTDPRALERYKALEARRLELRNRLNPGSNPA